MGATNGAASSGGFNQGTNRISKQNLRDNGNNLKEYGMSIITGGTTTKATPGSSGS
jgi:hypothetical protein